MAQPRVPTNLLEARGAFKKHPERAHARENEPVQVEPLGEPPERLTPEEKQAWVELVDEMYAGVLSKAHRKGMEQLAKLVARSWEGRLSEGRERLLKSLLSSFGMLPSDQSRVTAAKKTPTNKFSNLA